MLLSTAAAVGAIIGTVYFSARGRRQAWEGFAAGQNVEMPVEGVPPQWRDSFRRSEEALATIGFRRLLFSHNIRRTKLGIANCDSIYVSPEGEATVAHCFSREPGQEKDEEDFIARTRMQNGVWHASWGRTAVGCQMIAPIYAFYYYPEARDPVALAQQHLNMVAKRGLTGDRPRRFLTPEEYLQDENEERAAGAEYELSKVHRLGGLGAFLP